VREYAAVPISLVTGPAGADLQGVLMEALRAHLARGCRPLLVVPTEADRLRHRRELVGQGGAEGVGGSGGAEVAGGAKGEECADGVGGAGGAEVERFEGLFARVIARAGRRETALGALARERALASIASRVLGEEHVGPGLAGALAALTAELQARRVTPARLRHAAREARLSSLQPVCAIYGAYQAALSAGKWADRELRVTHALDELRRNPARWRGTPVLVHGFDDLTELELDAIETLGAVVDAPVTVSLPYEPGRAAFAGRAEAFHRLLSLAGDHTELPPRGERCAPASRAALHHLERWLFEQRPPHEPADGAGRLGEEGPPRVRADGAVRLLEGASPRAELELVAGEVRALLDEGVSAQEIAVVHRSPERVAWLMGEVLDDFDIPHEVPPGGRFAHTALGRALLGIARCALAARPQLGDLTAWLRAPGVLERVELADELEAIALRRGATDAAQARRLWKGQPAPLERIDRLRAAAIRGPGALLDALQAELERLAGGPARELPAELDAAHAAATALQELRELARGAPRLFPEPAGLIGVLEGLAVAGEHAPAAGVEQAPAAGAGQRSAGGDRHSFGGGGVVVSDPFSLGASRVRALFVCGMQEGVFPAPARIDPLLSREERRALAHASGLLLAPERDALADERYLLYALCSRPEQLLVLSWHAADEDGVPVAPSLFLDDVCDLFVEPLREQARRRHAGAVSWPGPGAPAGAMAARESAAERSLGAREWPAEPAPGARGQPDGREQQSVREQPIAPLGDERVLAELRERTLWSASSLESWAACPVRWFVERLLHARGLETDAEPIARGTLAHAALRDALERLREQTGSARLTPASVGKAKQLLNEALDEQCERLALSSAPERVPGAKRRLRADLERYLEHAAHGESPLEPTYFELEFGFSEDADCLPPLELGEGVKVRGRIDRIDVGEGGEAVVYDYKGRSAPPAARWASDGALQVALYMRAVRDLLGHAPIGGFYQPLAGRDIRPRGLFDADGDASLECVRTDRREHAEVQELLDACRDSALTAAAQARAGALEPRPGSCSYEGGCTYPTICRCEC
jgi:hypothetical protein